MSARHSYVPDEDGLTEVSTKDLATHHFVFGQTSSGMTSSHDRMWTQHFLAGNRSVVQVDLFDSSHDQVIGNDTLDLTSRDSSETHSLPRTKIVGYLDNHEDERRIVKAERQTGAVGALVLGFVVLMALAGWWMGG